MKAPSATGAPAAPTTAPVITGIAGTHAKAGTEGTTLRSTSRIQAGNYFSIEATVIVASAMLIFGYKVFTKGSSGTTMSLGEVGIWAAIVVFFYGAYLTFKSGAAALPKIFFTFGMILLLLAGIISYIFGWDTIPNLQQGAKEWAHAETEKKVENDLPKVRTVLKDGGTYEVSTDYWRVFTRPAGKCIGITDTNLDVKFPGNEEWIRSLDGTKTITTQILNLGESLNGEMCGG